jgi:hypothetical protein
MALSSNVIAYLTTWSEAFEQFYRPGVGDYLKRFGKTTRMIPRNPKRKVIGASMEITMKTRKNRSARMTTDLLAPPPDPGPGAYTTYNVRFNATTPASNDFSALQIGFRTNWYDIKKRTDSTFKDTMGDFIKQDIEDGLQDVAEEFAGSFHYGSNQKLGQVTTTTGIKDNDDDRFDRAGAYTAASTSCILKLDATAIAHIGDGELIDLYNRNDTTFEAKNVRVINVNPVDYTIVIAIETSPSQTYENDGTTALTHFNVLNASIVADDDIEVYLSGAYDHATQSAPTSKGSLDNFFDPSQAYFDIAAGGEGVGRFHPDKRALLPVRIDAGDSDNNPQALDVDHIRQAGEAVGWANGSYLDVDKRAMIMNRDQYRAINIGMQDIGMTVIPALQSDVGKSMNKAFGFDGWTLHDPTLGTVALTVDDMAAYGVIDFLDLNTWEMVEPFPGGESFDFMPGTFAKIWNRTMYNNDASAQNYASKYSGRPSKEFEAQGEQLYAWINVGPKRNVRLMNLTSDS